MEKSPDAFRTISEVAEDLDLPQHVLRFWETRFSQIRPLKRGGGRRYYRPDDIELLKGVRHYLYGEGYTIKGVQRILKERGVKHVIEIGRATTENFSPPVAALSRPEDRERRRQAAQEWPEATAATAPPAEEIAAPDLDGLPLLEELAQVPRGGTTPAPAADGPRAASFAPDDLRRLQSALFELMECRRLLDGQP